MVFARVAEYLSGTTSNQHLAPNNGQNIQNLDHGSGRRQDVQGIMEPEEVDLDAIRHPYEHVRRHSEEPYAEGQY